MNRIHRDPQMARALHRERGTYCPCRDCAYQFVLDALVCAELYEDSPEAMATLNLCLDELSGKGDPLWVAQRVEHLQRALTQPGFTDAEREAAKILLPMYARSDAEGKR